jgi:RecB family exonuclease
MTVMEKTISLPQFSDGNLLTNSAVKCWNQCRRRYYFQYVLGIRRAFDTEPLRIGSMWHLGVGLYEEGMAIGEAIATIRQAYADQPKPPYLTDEEYQVEEEKVAAMIEAHHHWYKDDQILKTVAIELPFSVPIINPETGRTTPSFSNAGKIDRIAQLPDDTIAIVERKTTGESIEATSPYWMALRNDPQISRYFIAAKQLGYDATKIIYDVVKKPQISPKAVAKKDQAWANSQGHYCGLTLNGPCPERETPAMYGARLLTDLKERKTDSGESYYFARKEIARLENDLTEFQSDLWYTQQEIRQAITNSRFYRNPASCLEPYTCAYLDVCHELYQDPEHIPEGFRRVAVLHEELVETKEGAK